jgi:outer membrane protein OmpA-like peptidoglycan-associated protein
VLANSALPRPSSAQDDDAPPGFVASEQVEAEGSATATTTQADGSTTTTTVVKAEAPPAAAPAGTAEGAPILAEAGAAESAAPADTDEARKAELRRVQNSWHGPAGGIHVVDAGSGAPLSVRLQLAADMFSTSDYLHEGDINDYFGGTLSLGVSVIEHLELYASIHSHANGNTQDSPQLLQVLGDLTLGGKGYAPITPWLTAGADLRFVFLNSIGTVGPVLASTSVGLRGLLSADLRSLPEKPVPLIARASIDYYLDNSSNLIEDVELARYNSLPPDMRDENIASEDSHLIRRVERFALTVNRMDMLTFGLGLELPLLAHGTPEEGWFIHPITEWTVGIPVNRQGYSCLLVATNTGRADADGCLDVEGFAAMPSTLTFGARVFPPKVPLSLLLGFDIGLSGTSTFVRELAPNRPWAFLIALGYSVDEGPRPDGRPVIVEREKLVVQDPPPLPRINGAVVDNATGAGIAGVIVTYADRSDLTAQATNASGGFVSYELPPAAAVRLTLTHPDYEPGECTVVIPEGQAAAPVPASAPTPAQEVVPPTPPAMPGAANDGLTLNPYLYGKSKQAAAPAGAPAGAPLESAKVPLRCELKAKPRAGSLRGEVVSEAGKPVVAAQIMITGASTHLLTSDGSGTFTLPQLIAGNYSVRVEADGFLLKIENVDVVAEQQASVRVELIPKPKTAQVELTQEEVRIRSSVFFKLNSAELSEQSNALLTEVVDVLVRNPQVTSVEVQGHTDGQGTAAQNLQLSQERAEAVRTWLINAGIAPDRLTAKGYGDTRPLLPNITERARARNRRVQFIIR